MQLSPATPQMSSKAASSPSDPDRMERDPLDLQNVHDDAEGPHVTGLVVLLRAQHLRGWQRGKQSPESKQQHRTRGI